MSEWSKRRDELHGKLEDQLIERLPSLDRETLERLARLMLDECGYLYEHLPQLREDVQPFACSEETYHLCSFSTPHAPWCKAVGGDGENTSQYKNARSCEPDCGKIDAQPWCQCSGFDCSTCSTVDDLLGILAASGEPFKAANA